MEPASSSAAELLVIGGQIAAGKSVLASGLAEVAGCKPIRVRQALQEVLGGAGWDRRRLQVEGASLDERTSGRWLLDYLRERTERGGRWVIDAGRTRRQVEPVLGGVVGSQLVYLRAHESIRRERYAMGQQFDLVKRSVSFEEAMTHRTEEEAPALAAMAHLVVDTDGLSVTEVCDVVRRWMRW